jgi:nitrate reductase NapAB chaperone NapD
MEPHVADARERLSMPIKSYLAHAAEGRRDELTRTLRGLSGCTIVPATNRDMVVLVTDTADEAAEQDLQNALTRVPGLQRLTLVAGLSDPDSPEAVEASFDERAEDHHDAP